MQTYPVISSALIGVLSVVLLGRSLISAGKRLNSGDRLQSLIAFTLAVVGLCVVVGLAVTYISTGAIK